MEQESEEKLPPNWSSRIDSRYNRRYYYNKQTKESSWTRPQLNESGPETPQKQRVKESPTSQRGEEDVWERVYSNTYDRYYYYNKKTGKTSWSNPAKPLKGKGSRDTSQLSREVDKLSISREDQKRRHSEKRSANKSGSFNDSTKADTSDEDEDSYMESKASDSTARDLDDDPEVFQQRMMEQFPALKKAFMELEEGQRRLQKEREEHEARVKRELEVVNAKLDELRRVSDIKKKAPEPSTDSAPAAAPPQGPRPRKYTLDQDLKRYSVDLERRSVNVVEKRKSMRASGVRMDDLKSVMEEANRLAAERGNAPATAESAAAQVGRISAKFPPPARESGDDEGDEEGELQEIMSEMNGVAKGLEYAMQEAAAQHEAAQEAQEAGDENDYYTLLGVAATATDAELKKAYRRKLIEWHPDKVKADKRDQAVRMTDMIQSAFKVLSDPWERDIYDWFGFEQYLLHVKVIACFKNYLVAGIELVKHPRKGRPRKRMVWLNNDFTEILTYRKRLMEDQRNGKEKIKGVSIQSITEVTTGRATDVLKRTGKASNSEKYFSLVCTDRTLDFECPSEESCSFIATRMKLLIIDLKRDKEWMHRHYDEMEQNQS